MNNLGKSILHLMLFLLILMCLMTQNKKAGGQDERSEKQADIKTQIHDPMGRGAFWHSGSGNRGKHGNECIQKLY